jgi:hypothetical protein
MSNQLKCAITVLVAVIIGLVIIAMLPPPEDPFITKIIQECADKIRGNPFAGKNPEATCRYGLRDGIEFYKNMKELRGG